MVRSCGRARGASLAVSFMPFQKGQLVLGALAAKSPVSMREPPETLYDVAVLDRVSQRLLVAERLEEHDCMLLVRRDLRMHERHVQELFLTRRETVIEIPVKRVAGDPQREIVGHEG